MRGASETLCASAEAAGLRRITALRRPSRPTSGTGSSKARRDARRPSSRGSTPTAPTPASTRGRSDPDHRPPAPLRAAGLRPRRHYGSCWRRSMPARRSSPTAASTSLRPACADGSGRRQRRYGRAHLHHAFRGGVGVDRRCLSDFRDGVPDALGSQPVQVQLAAPSDLTSSQLLIKALKTD